MRKLTRRFLFRDSNNGMLLDYYEDAIGNLLIESHNGNSANQPNIFIIPRTQLDEEQRNFLLKKGFSNTPL